jgi:hypothetical protein
MFSVSFWKLVLLQKGSANRTETDGYLSGRLEYIARPECVTSAGIHGLIWWADKVYAHINVRSTDAIYLHMRRHGHGGSRGYKTHTEKPVPLTDELSISVVDAINERWRRVYDQVCCAKIWLWKYLLQTNCIECVHAWPLQPTLVERRRIYTAAELCLRSLAVRQHPADGGESVFPCGAFAYDCCDAIRNASTPDIWADLRTTPHVAQEWLLVA